MGELVPFPACKNITLEADGHLTAQMAMKPLRSPSTLNSCVPETQEEIGSPSICGFKFPSPQSFLVWFGFALVAKCISMDS